MGCLTKKTARRLSTTVGAFAEWLLATSTFRSDPRRLGSPRRAAGYLKCPRLRFSLATLLVAITVFCGLLAWWKGQQLRARAQRDAVLRLETDFGARIAYDYGNRDDGSLWLSPWPRGPRWIHRMLGREFLGSPRYVALHGQFHADRYLRDIVTFEETEYLILFGCDIDDSHLSQLTRLRRLKTLVLVGTRMTAEGVERIQRDLPECDIY